MTTSTDTLQSARDELARLLAIAGWDYPRLCRMFGWRVISWDKNRHPHPPGVETLGEGDLRQFCYLLQNNVINWKIEWKK